MNLFIIQIDKISKDLPRHPLLKKTKLGDSPLLVDDNDVHLQLDQRDDTENETRLITIKNMYENRENTYLKSKC